MRKALFGGGERRFLKIQNSFKKTHGSSFGFRRRKPWAAQTGSTRRKKPHAFFRNSPQPTLFFGFDLRKNGGAFFAGQGTVKYYLTASSNEGNGSSGSSSSSVGNVFWTSSNCGERQNWAYHEPKTSTTGAAIVPYIGNYISQQTYELNSNYLKGMSLYDWQQHACDVIATMYGMRAIDEDTSYQPEKVYDKGFVSKGTTEMSWNGTTDYGFRLTKTAGSWNTLKSTVFDEIIAGRPVIIYLKGTGTHFVTAYKLAAGTTRSGISPENVYVMDPWTSGNQTLYDVMHYGSYWTNVSNIRTFV